MNPEIKTLWIADLQSGLHLQGKRALKRLNADGKFAYCCLGRLCELAVRAGVIPESKPEYEDNPVHQYGSGDPEFFDSYRTDVLPLAVQKWAGLDSDNPGITLNNRILAHSLAGLNDDGATFEEIAAVIAEQL